MTTQSADELDLHHGETMLACDTHTDGVLFTILRQFDVSGLQVEAFDKDTGNFTWIDVPVSDSVILNTGVALQRMTNDAWNATNHRVLHTNGQKRFSVPFFFSGSYDGILKPIAASVAASPLKVPLYPALPYGKYLNLQNSRHKEYNSSTADDCSEGGPDHSAQHCTGLLGVKRHRGSGQGEALYWRIPNVDLFCFSTGTMFLAGSLSDIHATLWQLEAGLCLLLLHLLFRCCSPRVQPLPTLSDEETYPLVPRRPTTRTRAAHSGQTRVCVTGGCGFLGSSIVRQLQQRGYHVTTLSIFR